MAASKMSNVGSTTPPAVTPYRRLGRSRCFLDEQNVCCPVCLDVIYQATSVAPCNHKFCAACILQWADGSNTCPKCRIRMRGMSRDTFAQQIIDQYLEMYPERRRPQARIDAADQIELKFLEKMIQADDDDSSDDDSIFFDGENSFDDSGILHLRRRRIPSDYQRDEFMARIARLRDQGVVASPPRAVRNIPRIAAPMAPPPVRNPAPRQIAQDWHAVIRQAFLGDPRRPPPAVVRHGVVFGRPPPPPPPVVVNVRQRDNRRGVVARQADPPPPVVAAPPDPAPPAQEAPQPEEDDPLPPPPPGPVTRARARRDRRLQPYQRL